MDRGDKWLSIKRNDGQPFLINAFRVNDGTLDGYRGLDYTLQGKMDADATWTDLYEVIDEPSSGDFSHYFPNIGAHSYSQYRLLFKRYALVNKRMAVSLFQLYYVEGIPGSKSFEFSDTSKEVTFVSEEKTPGSYIKSVSFSSAWLPRTFNLVMSNSSVINAGQQNYINSVGQAYPWGTSGGYLTKDEQGNYGTKPLVFEGLNATIAGDGTTVVTYNAPSPLKYSEDAVDVHVISAAPATAFVQSPAGVWTNLPLSAKKLDSSSDVSATVKRLATGKYLVRGSVTVTSPSGAAIILATVDGITLLQGLGGFAGRLDVSTMQLHLVGVIELLEDTDVVLKMWTSAVTNTSTSMASKTVIHSEHTKIHFFKV